MSKWVWSADSVHLYQGC